MIIENKKIGEILLDAGVITKEQLESALDKQKLWGGKLGITMVQLGYFDENFLLELLSEKLNIEKINISRKKIDSSLLELFPKSLIFKHKFLPVENNQTSIKICISDPSNEIAFNEIQKSVDKEIQIVLDTEKSIIKTINTLFDVQLQPKEYSEIKEFKEDKIFEKLVNSIDKSVFDGFVTENFNTKTNSYLINAIFMLENGIKDIELTEEVKALKIKIKSLIKILNKKGFTIPEYED